MKTFLEYVAKDIIQKYGTDLSRIAVVFPNKRASLFLNEYLARLSGKPIWSPAYITISDLFRQHSERTVADPIKLICDLHKSFIRQTGIDETLDHFYSWGQLLLADFDDLDKNMADPDRVLANLRDIHELDDVSYLTEEQKAVIRQFFSNFSEEHNSELKERFLKLWSHMAEIYHDFNDALAAQKLAYEGALYREVAMREDINFGYDRYLFVGFNMVQRVEQRLFTLLKQQGKARFYWDFDHYYMKGNEAGHFIGQYLADFPNELDMTDSDVYNQFTEPKHITFIAAPTENIQARYASQWLREGSRLADGRETAIVLANEGLLQTVIHCLPDETEKVNITTGYPLGQAPISALITLLIELRTNGFDSSRNRFRLHQVNAVLRHPYINRLSEEIPRLTGLLNERKIYYPSSELLSVDEPTTLLFRPFTPSETPQTISLLYYLSDIMQMVARQTESTDPLFQESVFRAYTLLNRLLALAESDDLHIDINTLQRLIGQLIQSTSIPFHGEPAEGLQIMGVLETRNLDFRHVLLLSCNEGNIPKGISDTSFIPYNIRKAYGLTTIDHKVAIYSYYFHRMLQRAEDITIVYNNATTDGQRGEMSRFLLQLMVESQHHIEKKTLQAGQAYTPFHPQAVEKTDEVMQKLLHRFSSTRPSIGSPQRLRDTECSLLSPLLTPTAINRYMRCQLQFYYSYVCGLREPDINDEDAIDNRIFGNIFHEVSRIIYTRLMQQSRRILKNDLERLLKSRVEIEMAVDAAFRTELFQIRDPHAEFRMELNGLQIINREVIIHYLRQLLTIDCQLAPFTIIDLEGDVIEELSTAHLKTTIGGRIDRLDMITDEQGDHIRVIDYKTGAARLKPLSDVDAIFAQESLAQHSDYYLQTFLYAILVKHRYPQVRVSPALLFIQHAGKEEYNPILKFGNEEIDDVTPHAERFELLLRETIDDIFDQSKRFLPTDDSNRCRTCPFRLLCQ